ncbi:hypothetical protein VCHA53O466_50098 [Vibrio chagasii]|nr:hypothetical protein VCHA53O466_50098 [Vibrio chagasii]
MRINKPMLSVAYTRPRTASSSLRVEPVKAIPVAKSIYREEPLYHNRTVGKFDATSYDSYGELARASDSTISVMA